MMKLRIFKKYDLFIHSYMALLQVESDDADPAVFVVHNIEPRTDVSCSSSSSSSSSGSSSSSSTSVSSSSTSLSSSSSSSSSSTSISSSSSSTSVSASSESSSSTSDSSTSISSSSSLSISSSSTSVSSSSSSSFDLFELVTTDIELVSVASLADHEFYGTVSVPAGLYRLSEISLAFKTEAQMETTLKSIVEDVEINGRIQKIPLVEVKVVTLEADLVEPNPNPLIF